MCCVLIDHIYLTLQHHLAGFPSTWIHYAEALGSAGVSAFFVHTSLVLMYSLQSMHGGGGSVTLRFYLRRIFRIYPLAIAAIAIAIVFHIPQDTWNNPDAITPAVIMANLLLVQNLWTRIEVLGPMWSLPFEVEMYVLLPALYVLASRRRAPAYLLAVFVFFCAFGTLLNLKTGHMSLFAYVPCFLAGVLCYAVRKHQRARVPALFWAPFLAVLLLGYLFLNRHESFQPNFWSRWVYCLALGLGINCFADLKVPSVNYAMGRIATFSYGVYLWHSVMLYLVFVVWRMQQAGAAVLAVLLFTWLASVASFYLIESPFIGLGRKLTSDGFGGTRQEVDAPAPAP